ncbi:MAG: oxalurate catabolism protein HpxZ [Rhodospirillaceae bacterium]|nr:oxalurate catabolism protein HpxZ [Rhodospirillaceae bacterium]
MEIDLPEIVAEVTAEFRRYEKALVTNDVDALDDFFWRDERALRFGLGESLFGHAAIAEFRAARPAVDLDRDLLNTVITTYGRDFATANTEYRRKASGRLGRQSQTWVRFPQGWRIVCAHVSFAAN